MTQYDDIIITPVYGPLNSNNYPSTIPYHSYGTLPGSKPTPPQFYPSQDPPFAEENTNARQQYIRTAVNKNYLEKQILEAKNGNPAMYHSISTSRQVPVSQHMNYIAPIPSSMFVNIRKSNAIGQNVNKIGLPISQPVGTKSYYPSGTRSSLRRARSGGCVAPAKKGSIYNTSLGNGQVCAWGALPRQTY